MSAAVELDGVAKEYRRYGPGRRAGTLKSALLGGRLRDLAPTEILRAVDGVSLRIPRGSAFGIVGRNGSGKSTLLKLMAGITRPTAGSVKVHGRVSALIELGAGFHPEISGRENVFINGVMLGLTRREIARRFDEIVEFAEMEDFIDAPVRTYSSGMYMRLGFAVAVHVDADVLLVDEVLAVGDERFSLKCLDKFAEYKRRGKTTVLVTHGLDVVERFCDEALWLDAGRVRTEGDPRRVLHAYRGDVETEEEHELAVADEKARQAVEAESVTGGDQGEPADAPAEPAPAEAQAAEPPEAPAEAPPDEPEDMFKAASGRWGDGPVRIDDVRLEGGERSGAPLPLRREAGDPHAGQRARGGVGLRLRDQHLQRRRRLLLRHQHRYRALPPGRAVRGGRGGVRHRQPRPGRGHVQAGRRRPPPRRRTVRLPPPALHVPREVADPRRGHLPARPFVDVHAEHPLRGAVGPCPASLRR